MLELASLRTRDDAGKGQSADDRGVARRGQAEGEGRGELSRLIHLIQPRCSLPHVQFKYTHLSLRCSIISMHFEQ